MRETNKHFQLLNAETPSVAIPLTHTYNYLSLTPSETSFNHTSFWADIYKQEETIDDWNEPELLTLQCIYLDSLEGDSDLAIDTLLWTRYPTLVSFFSSQMVDIPRSFRKSKSLYSPSMTTPQLRLITMLMSHGRKAYTSKLYSLSVQSLLAKLSRRVTETHGHTDWRVYFNVFTNFRVFSNFSNSSNYLFSKKLPRLSFTDKFRQSYTSTESESITDRWAHITINDELMRYLPLFSFYIKKVDKMKRKHSRGKSGKYSIEWKYVPKYKRFITVLRWLVKDIRFQKSKTFSSRITKSIEGLLFDKPNHLVYKLRHFVHHFVFQHHKKSLLKTLKSAS